MKQLLLEITDTDFPTALVERLGDAAPRCLFAMGDVTALRNRMLGLICSIQCPGSVVIKTFDAIRTLREEGVVVIGGFHSPMEKECLEILLRGEQPVILCPARSLQGLRLEQRLRKAMESGQLLLISPFGERIRRATVAQAVERNELVAAIAGALFVPHASPGGKTWGTIGSASKRGQPVYTLDDDQNAALSDAGSLHLPVPFTWKHEAEKEG